MHAAVSTPREVLASLTHRSTGGDLDQVERIIEGYDNEVYRVGTAQGDDVVIRIRRFGGNLHTALAEARAIEKRARPVSQGRRSSCWTR